MASGTQQLQQLINIKHGLESSASELEWADCGFKDTQRLTCMAVLQATMALMCSMRTLRVAHPCRLRRTPPDMMRWPS